MHTNVRPARRTTSGIDEAILRGRLLFTPHHDVVTGDIDGYEFSGPTRFDKLFTGIAVEAPPPTTGYTGAEDIGPEDTFDGDYGRLLDRAYLAMQKNVKGMASPPGFEPGFQP